MAREIDNLPRLPVFNEPLVHALKLYADDIDGKFLSEQESTLLANALRACAKKLEDVTKELIKAVRP